ncbi:putative RNA-directed DNA polymerase from transposon BS [Araneus ventricosus]|uniref:Putative RNA-directed DNA polymerase from transposon BS n=1 Tax=Araneus ventricosus TaxID=182803 RepID=A0A4Y2LYD8_ARAVE|nr:putative RNA-directed DNA polymerase from transposon BS [Araneus ventricosus]
MVLIRLQFFLDKNNLLPEEQFGFRRGHSTTDQVLYFAQTLRDAQNLRRTHHSVAALLDLMKAFDRVWKHKLIIKLHDTFNIRGNTLAWISDYFHQRFIRVKFNKTLSNTFHLSQGVPQGAVLSPTLFALYMARIEKVVSPGTHIGLFADDIALWSSGNIIVEIESRFNSCLEALSIFAEELKMSFNPVKSISTFFITNKRLHNYQPSLMLKHQDLTYEKHTKYLGFILDPEFTSSKHITVKARKRLNILKYITDRDWGAHVTTLRISFQALVRPILE